MVRKWIFNGNDFWVYFDCIILSQGYLYQKKTTCLKMDPSTTDKSKANIKVKFTLVIMNWVRLNSNKDESNQFPLDVIQLIVNVFLYENIKILQFNEELKHEEVSLHDDRTRATSQKPTTNGCAHVMVDCEPVISGVHVWRIKVCPIHL